MHAPFTSLAGRIVDLRPFTADDVTETYVSWLRDPVNVRFSNQRFRTHTVESCRAYLASFSGTPNLFLAVVARDSGKVVGTMTAYVAEPHRTADMGILIGDRTAWGRGFGLDAWETLMSYLLGEAGLRKVTAGTLRPNAAMVRIMERSGMKREAVRERQEIVEGAPVDVLYYARFRPE